jgi:hypothetical protein
MAQNSLHIKQLYKQFDAVRKICDLMNDCFLQEPNSHAVCSKYSTTFSLPDLISMADSQWMNTLQRNFAVNGEAVLVGMLPATNVYFHRQLAEIWAELDELTQCKLSNGVAIQVVWREIGVQIAEINRENMSVASTSRFTPTGCTKLG